MLGFAGVSVVKNPPANAGNVGSIPELGRSPGEGNGNLIQYPCLENPMDGGVWEATVHRVAKSRTQLRDFTFSLHNVRSKHCFIYSHAMQCNTLIHIT